MAINPPQAGAQPGAQPQAVQVQPYVSGNQMDWRRLGYGLLAWGLLALTAYGSYSIYQGCNSDKNRRVETSIPLQRENPVLVDNSENKRPIIVNITNILPEQKQEKQEAKKEQPKDLTEIVNVGVKSSYETALLRPLEAMYRLNLEGYNVQMADGYGRADVSCGRVKLTAQNAQIYDIKKFVLVNENTRKELSGKKMNAPSDSVYLNIVEPGVYDVEATIQRREGNKVERKTEVLRLIAGYARCDSGKKAVKPYSDGNDLTFRQQRDNLYMDH